jgi:hypothetical protein
MTRSRIFEYLSHQASHGPPDQRSSSCFDENQAPIWAYRYNNLDADVREKPSVLAHASIELPPGRDILYAGNVVSNISLDLKVGGHHIRLQDVVLTLIATTRMPDSYASPCLVETSLV